MRRVLAVALLAAALGLGCDLGVQQRTATRTMNGVTSSQVAAAAQGAFVDKGFDLAAVSSANGFVKTAWRETARRQLMFTVSTDQVTDEEGDDLRGVKTVTVTGFARHRLVGGWSEEYQTDYRIYEVLDAVADRLTDPSAKPVRVRVAAPKPRAECASTSECPSGEHCADERCVKECADDEGCEEGQSCDDRGRCVTPPPEAKPTPAATPPATDDAPVDQPPAAAEDEGADDAEGVDDEDEEVTP